MKENNMKATVKDGFKLGIGFMLAAAIGQLGIALVGVLIYLAVTL